MCVARTLPSAVQAKECVAYSEKIGNQQGSPCSRTEMPGFKEKIDNQVLLNKALRNLEKQYQNGSINKLEYTIKKAGLKIAGAIDTTNIVINCVA